MAALSTIAVAILLGILHVAADGRAYVPQMESPSGYFRRNRLQMLGFQSGRFSAKGPMERQQPRSGSKAVRNVLFASKIWLNAEQSRKITELQAKGNDEEVVRQLTEFYRGLSDKSRAALRVQSTCRALLSDEVGQSATDELIAMKTKIINSLFRNVKNSDVKVIQPLCVAAYEDSHVPTANDPRRLRRSMEVASAA
ncbi:hypothetical protein Y032_0703g1672 [Ancylostoma ceylanicum]|uniref:Polyprotein allergen nematode domain-containing protein n=1 Tax=Ancylostoma ceylanicum TaxID=53326 RepID=A0A016WGD1_9BILA|nr:hypothetical protein Y032_0703g1672 [Ancylostoma ceylanicum]